VVDILQCAVVGPQVEIVVEMIHRIQLLSGRTLRELGRIMNSAPKPA
jgi:hypothetical protein